MKIKYIGENSSPLSLINGKIYECLGRECDRYRVIDETGEDYLYPIEDFEELMANEKTTFEKYTLYWNICINNQNITFLVCIQFKFLFYVK